MRNFFGDKTLGVNLPVYTFFLILRYACWCSCVLATVNFQFSIVGILYFISEKFVVKRYVTIHCSVYKLKYMNFVSFVLILKYLFEILTSFIFIYFLISETFLNSFTSVCRLMWEVQSLSITDLGIQCLTKVHLFESR